MAKSISQAQAEALAEGFLDTVGSSKDDFKPRKSLSALVRIAGRVIEKAQENLNKADRVASGALSDSLTIKDPEINGKVISVSITALFYWKFINDGVKGVKTKRPTSTKWSFKNLFVGGRMFNAIKKWIRKEGIKAKTNVGGKPITTRERKRKSLKNSGNINSLTFAIATSVKAKGLKKTNFMTNAISFGSTIAKKELGAAFKQDIIEAIPKTL